MIIRTALDDGWTLRIADGGDARSLVPAHVWEALPIPATVPGTVHTDLLAAGLIPDPYLGANEELVQWIGWVDWVYERVLDRVDGGAVLEFDGLDTIATVCVDDCVVLSSANQHRRYSVDVSAHVAHGPTTLSVRFRSAMAYGEAERRRLGDYPSQYPGPFNYLRKSACNFGWDWGPSLVTAGIWRPVRLVTGSGARIEEVRPTTEVLGSVGRARFDIRLAGASVQAAQVRARVGEHVVVAPVARGSDRVHLEIEIPDIRLWWPVGLGAPDLYDARVDLLDETAAVVDSWGERLGFRSFRLDTAEDADGSAFRFVVNETDVFVRGVNWIPDDCFLPRVGPDRLAQRLDQAVDANVNLIRVWGGGVYESADFYRACDERGLLVWQDFLFACATYPEDAGLAAEIDAEARDNVARLMPHPSLVLWNGNNENFWGILDWEWDEPLGGKPWGSTYYLQTLPAVVAEVDPARPYWPGSPYAGDPGRHPNDPDHGPSHIWDVWNQRDYLAYADHRPRFAAEFGWQAPPTWATFAQAIGGDPLDPESIPMRAHQKAEDGAAKLARGWAPHLPDPISTDDWLFTTQLIQARAVRFGVEHLRSLRSRCAGTVVWQLNDCWPVVSWAAIDSYGRKKPLWHALRDAYSPRLVTWHEDGGVLAAVVVNDLPHPWRGSLRLRRVAFEGAILAEQTVEFEVAPSDAVRLPADAVLLAAAPREEVLVAEIVDGPPAPRAEHFFAEDRELRLRDDAAVVRVARASDGVIDIEVRASTLVRSLCIFPDRIQPDAECDSALVTLLPGETRRFRVTGVPARRAEELLSAPVLRTVNELVASVATRA